MCPTGASIGISAEVDVVDRLALRVLGAGLNGQVGNVEKRHADFSYPG